MAVPALRVLESQSSSEHSSNHNPNSRKVKVKIPFGQVKVSGGKLGMVGLAGLNDSEGAGDEIVDHVDERGYVDGVKVARKCSKANVLGKAVEYIT
jgi:hypothetical protein